MGQKPRVLLKTGGGLQNLFRQRRIQCCGIEIVQSFHQPAEDSEWIHTANILHRLRVYRSPKGSGLPRTRHALVESYQKFELASRYRTGCNPRTSACCTTSSATFCSPGSPPQIALANYAAHLPHREEGLTSWTICTEWARRRSGPSSRLVIPMGAWSRSQAVP